MPRRRPPAGAAPSVTYSTVALAGPGWPWSGARRTARTRAPSKHVGPGIGGKPQQQRVEVMAHHLPPGRSIGEGGGPHSRLPPTRPCCRCWPGTRPRRLPPSHPAGRTASGNWAAATRRASATARRSRPAGGPNAPTTASSRAAAAPAGPPPMTSASTAARGHRVIVPRAAPAEPTEVHLRSRGRVRRCRTPAGSTFTRSSARHACRATALTRYRSVP